MPAINYSYSSVSAQLCHDYYFLQLTSCNEELFPTEICQPVLLYYKIETVVIKKLKIKSLISTSGKKNLRKIISDIRNFKVTVIDHVYSPHVTDMMAPNNSWYLYYFPRKTCFATPRLSQLWLQGSQSHCQNLCR